MTNSAAKEIETQEWDLVLKPSTSLFDLQLKQVWKYRDLLILFVKRDFVAQYKQTILGPLWHIIQPVLTTIMFLFIFTKVARIATPVPPVLFYMSGLSVWNYFAGCLTGTSSTFTVNASIFGKVYFPRLVTPLATICSMVVKFGIQFLLLFGIMCWSHFTGRYAFHFSVYWLLIPLFILMMALMGLGLGIIISSLTTKYRDFAVLLSFGVQLLMYLTPVAYPLSYLDNTKYKAFVALNPLSSIVEGFRYALFQQGTLDINGLIYSACFILLALFIGLLVFSKIERSFMDTV